MSTKHNPPSITETAFECPHCGAYTTQHWHSLSAVQISNEDRTPNIPPPNLREVIEKKQHGLEPEFVEDWIKWADSMSTGLMFFSKIEYGKSVYNTVDNLNISECFNCNKLAVWVHKSLVFPSTKLGVIPNSDLPPEIAADFEEARGIINTSPRGAAALLRLCVQKLCVVLGEKGRNIDDDIASLVSKGLNPLVQQSLDVVRVIGNEAVHPGTLDLSDDQESAMQLLRLVNLIAEQMITHPKEVKAMYDKLPKEKLAAIEVRNDRATK